MTCENECTLDFETGDRYCPKVARWDNGCPFDGLETNAADDENLNNRKEPEMANETIADIIAEIRREMPVYASGILCSNMTEVAVHEFADRIEAAYKSELQAHVKNFESTINNLVDENAQLKAENAKLAAEALAAEGGAK